MNLRWRGRLLLALIAIPLLAILGYGLVRGICWFFMTYLPARGGPIIRPSP